MTSKNSEYFVYWDSPVFLAWINNEQERAPIVEGMFNEIIKEKEGKIITSAISIVEVAAAKFEKERNVLDPEAEKQIDALWKDPHVMIVEAPSHIMFMAKKIMRQVIPKGWSLKGYDAVHLATAKFVENNGILVQEFNTYDEKLFKYSSIINIGIQKPHYESKPEQMSYLEDDD